MLVFIVLFLAIIALLLYLDAQKPKNFPPGPKWFPVLGSALEVSNLRRCKESLAGAAAALYDEYGPIIGLKLGQEKIIVCYGSSAIKEFLTNDALNGRPTGPFYELRTFGRNGILLTDEEFWAQQRRFILRHLREFGFGKRNMSELIEQEAEVMLQHLKCKIGKDGEMLVQMDTMCGIHVLNTIWTMLAGTRYSPEDKNLRHLQNILSELFKHIDMIGAPFSQFPLLRYFAPDISGYNLYMQTHRPLWDFIQKEIKSHKSTHEHGNPRDLIDVYLEMLNRPDRPKSFSEDQLLAICLDMFEAGSETTTKSLNFCFLYLLLNPHVQKTAQEEIDRVVGRERLPSLSDRPNMPYVEGIVMEAIRQFMSRTLGVPHRALKDTELCGYHIPKNTMLVPCFHGVLAGKESPWYADGREFKPERFIENGAIKQSDSFIPFGMGKRRCLGETLAKGNLFIFISSLLQNFDFRIPDGEEPPSTGTVDGVTAATVPFKGIVSLRQC